jgi:carbonic anhydrase
LGHENCGAVKAVLEGKTTKDIENIVPLIQPAIEQSKKLPGSPLVNAIQTNVNLIVEQLKKNPTLQPLIQKNQLKIQGAYYELEKGNVQLISR